MDTSTFDSLRDTLRLAHGAERLLWLPAGTELYACRGRLSLRGGPVVVGEALFRGARLLHAGQSQRVDEAGWYRLTAHAGRAELICVGSPARGVPWVDTLARRLAAVLRWRPSAHHRAV